MLLMNDDTKTKIGPLPLSLFSLKHLKKECMMSLLLTTLLGGVVAGNVG